MEVVVVAHNIRSMHNVGSIFRATYCFGVKKLFLTGYTATPPQKEISKVSICTEEFVDWEYRDDVELLIDELKEKGYVVAALEIDERSVNIGTFSTDKPVALILGNEVEGIDQSLLDKSDVILEIPYTGKRTSINLSVATGIALYELRG